MSAVLVAPDLPLWAMWLVGALLLSGAVVTLLGAIGLLRFRSFYERAHPPTLGMTLGTALVVFACILSFSLIEGHLALRALLILVFVIVTAPASMLILLEAAFTQDHREGLNPEAEARPTPGGGEGAGGGEGEHDHL